MRDRGYIACHSALWVSYERHLAPAGCVFEAISLVPILDEPPFCPPLEDYLQLPAEESDNRYLAKIVEGMVLRYGDTMVAESARIWSFHASVMYTYHDEHEIVTIMTMLLRALNRRSQWALHCDYCILGIV